MASGELAVQYGKLPEWLLARRVIPENYAALLTGIDAKVQEALGEQVQDASAKALIAEHHALSAGSDNQALSYFEARDIYEALAKSPEGQSKTFLGAHTHPGAAKWQAVVDAFRGRKHLGWISEARKLIQNVSYEIPALKKHAAACERQVLEATQRQTELTRLEANAKSRYEELLRDLGIDGVLEPRRELQALPLQELPGVREELTALLQAKGQELTGYYEAFAKHAACGGKQGSKQEQGGLGAASGQAEWLPLMTALFASHGQAAAAEAVVSVVSIEDLETQVPALRKRRLEASTAAVPGRKQDAPKGAASGASGSEQRPGVSEGIDWGLSPSLCVASEAEGVETKSINWDFEVEVTGASASSEPTAIDWDISASDERGQDTTTADTSAVIDWGGISFDGLVELRGEGAEGQEADRGEDEGFDLLSDRPTRELLYQEVAELGSFLRERCSELAGTSADEDCGPGGEAQKSLQEVKALADVTQRAEELLAGRRIQRLLLLQTSERYLDQYVKRVEMAKAHCGKPVTQRAALDKVKAEQAEEAKRTRAEIEKLRAATRKVQRELEAELGTYFKTTVRIVGDIAQI